MVATTSTRPIDPTGKVLSDQENRALSDEMAALKAELSRLSELVGDIAGKRYRRAKDQASDLAEDIANKGAALQEEAIHRASLIEDELQRTVRDRPLTSVAVAAGVGYLIGLLSRSRR